MSRPFTFSTAERACACPGSQALPGVGSDSVPARRGSVLHDFARRVKDVGYDEALAAVPDDMRDDIAQYDLTGLPDDPAAFASEVAFALDLETGEARELGRNLERRYDQAGALPHEVVGAADFVSLLGHSAVDVADLKTGHGAVPPARSNLQLGGLAVAATRAYRRTSARVRLLVRREDGTGYFDTAELDEFDLDGMLLRLQDGARRVHEARADVAAGRQPQLHEGHWCTYCPARASCPAKVSLIRALAVAPQTMLDEQVRALLTPELAAVAFLRLKTIKTVVHAVEHALLEFARTQPIDLGDGMVYGERDVTKTEIDGVKAHQILTQHYGREVADLACEMETSKAAIGRALRTIAPPRGLTKMQDQVLELLQAAGGIESTTGRRLDVHKAGETA